MSNTIKNTFFYTIGNLVTAFSSFLLLPVITGFLGVENYGIVNLMQTFSTILIIFMTLAIERSLFRVFYDYKTDYEQKTFISTLFYSILFVSSCFLIICFLLQNVLTQLFDSIPFVPFLSTTIIFTFLQSIITYTQVVRQVQRNAKYYVFTSVLLFSTSNIATLIFLIKLDMGAMSVLNGTLVGCIFTLPFALYPLRKIFAFPINKKMLFAALKFAYPMLLSLIFAWVLNMSDRLFLANYISSKAVGLYSLGAKFSSVIILFSGAIYQVYNPLFFQKTNSLSEITAKKELYEINNVIIFIISAFSLFIFFFSKEILNCFFSIDYSDSLFFIRILIFSCFISQIVGLLSSMIYQNKKTGKVSLGIMFAGIISFSINFYFIPIMGAKVAAISNLLSSIFLFFYMYLFARKNYYILLNFKFLGFVLLLGNTIFLIEYFCESLFLLIFVKNVVLLVSFLFAYKLNLLSFDVKKYAISIYKVIKK